jgi:triacylglycerol lipase
MRVEPYTTRLTRGTAYWMARIAHSVYIKAAGTAPDERGILIDLQAEDADFVAVVGADKNHPFTTRIESARYGAFEANQHQTSGERPPS